MTTEFAHPVERALPRVFDAHGISWQHEPVRLARERAGASVEIPVRRDFERLTPVLGLKELHDAGRPESDVSTAVGTGTDSRDMSEGVRTLETSEVFRVDVDHEPYVSVVTVAGDVDLHSAPILRARLAALADAYVDHVVLDLSDATFLDSMALGVMLAAQKRLVAASGRLDLVVPKPEIRRIFEITMLDQVFDLHDTRAQAIHANGDRAS
jgi:anti-anti-sigma factor